MDVDARVAWEAKGRLRKELLARREALDAGERARAAAAVSARLAELLPSDGLVMAYVPIRGEVDPLAFVCQIWARGGDVVFPAVVKGEGLIARRVRRFSQLAPATFGLLEPIVSCPIVAPGEIDAVLVPGLTYDRRGFRLGYGGGYYDRFLPLLKDAAITVGLAYEALLIDRLPVEAHDRPVRWIVTEEGRHGPFEGKEGPR